MRLRARKTQALLAYLASPPGQTHSRDKLAALLQLQWIVESTDTAPPASAVSLAEVPAGLPATLREKLHAQLEMGYVQGFIEQLDAAENGAPELATLLEPLRTLARRFRLTELAQLLAPTQQVKPDA